jgi:glycosyltransferase involved in cell wall biosynthesis
VASGFDPRVSVIVPTFNRAERLGRLLDDLIGQRCDLPYEILVVDNGSSDQTRAIVERASRRTPHVRYLYEPRAGASNARNRGIEAARGAVLAFIDDDVRASADWVQRIARTFEAHPEIDCLGGRIEPLWPCEPPAWLTSAHWPPLALQTARGSAPYLDRDHASACLVTANFACRASVLAEVGGFSPAYLRDEDRELNMRLWRAGKRGKYEDSIVARAEVQPERLTKRYHRSWYRVTGCSHARLRYRELIDRDGRLLDALPEGRCVLGVPGFLYRELAVHCWRFLVSLTRGGPGDTFFEECRIRYLAAYVLTRWRSALEARLRSVFASWPRKETTRAAV